MAKVPMELVKKLREMSGAGMLDCKNALEEADGDLDKAYTILREKGIAKAVKRAGRATGQGVVEAYLHRLGNDFPPQVGEGVGQRLVGLTGADGDRVEFHGRLPTDAPAYERLVYPDFCQRKGAWRRKPGVKIESRFGAQQIRIYAWPGDGKAKGWKGKCRNARRKKTAKIRSRSRRIRWKCAGSAEF